MTTAADTLGLSLDEASRRLAAEGPNTVAAPPRTRLVARIARQLTDPLVALLVAAFVVTIVIGDMTDALVIAFVVVVNSAIGITQEIRADRAVAALSQLAAPEATVVRGGRDAQIPAAEVVRGDLVRLAAGDIVPADVSVTEAQRLQLDESAVTGESVPVWHVVGDTVQAGTVVVAGRALGEVVRTGADSGLGRIAQLVATTRAGPTPLQRRLASLGRLLGATTVALAAVVFGVGVLTGQPTLTMAITAVSLVVAAVPESLPAVVTLALALGARRMATHRAIPRRLHSVETLGSVTVVASDKTGTITEGRMAVQRAVEAAGRAYTVTGSGYEPRGVVSGPTAAPSSELIDLARAGLLCNDASIAMAPATGAEDSGGGVAPIWMAHGDPLEAALVAFAARCGLDVARERGGWPRLAEEPFDQEKRRMTTWHRGPGGRLMTICKGAPESVLGLPGLASPAPGVADAARGLAESGLRVLAIAAAVESDIQDVRDIERTGLRLLGFVGIGDPVRTSAPAVAADFAGAGIRLLLVTGDHPGTAASVGDRLGIWRAGDDVHRSDLGPPDAGRADEVRVFARTRPEQKLDIIAALQARGHVVAMTGDGVNDAPGLRKADIGVAMGGGTEVARQAADVILVDDNLGTLTGAVREGRRIYDNIRRFLLYGLAGGAAELLVMLFGPAFGLSLPLLPAQILWINLLTHGVPGVALGAEPAEPDVMRRPPRPPRESVLGGGLLSGVLITAVLLAAATMAAGVIAHASGRPWQSIIFVVLGLAQLGVALGVAVPRSPGVEGNPGLGIAVAVAALLQVSGVLLPPLRELLGTEPLNLGEFAACLVVAAVPGLVVRLYRRGRRLGTIRS